MINLRNEVTIMLQQKTKPAAKKAIAGSSTITAGKPKPPKTAVNIAAKKVAATAVKKDQKKTTAARKSAAPAAGRKLLAKKAATTRANPDAADRKAARPTPEEHYHMVETAAYFIAERNGFQGCPSEHWAEAELEIAGMLCNN